MSIKLLLLGFVFVLVSLLTSTEASAFNCDTLTQDDWKKSQVYKTMTYNNYIEYCHQSKAIIVTGSLILLFSGLGLAVISVVKLLIKIKSTGFKKLWNSSCPKCGRVYGFGFIYIPKPEWNTGFTELCKTCFKEIERHKQ